MKVYNMIIKARDILLNSAHAIVEHAVASCLSLETRHILSY